MFLKGLRGHNNEGEGFCIKGFAANTSKYPDEAESSCAMHPSSSNSGFTLPCYGVWGSHCAGRRFRTKLKSRYIGAGQNDRVDVRIQELVSKAENPGGFLRKNVFLGPFLGYFLVAWPFLHQSS